MSKIKIDNDDILWKYYRRSAEILREPLVPPKTLCQYFWTAVLGMILSFMVHARVWVLWLTVGLISLAINQNLVRSPAVGVPLAIVTMVIVFVAGCRSMVPVAKWIDRQPKKRQNRIANGAGGLLAAASGAGVFELCRTGKIGEVLLAVLCSVAGSMAFFGLLVGFVVAAVKVGSMLDRVTETTTTRARLTRFCRQTWDALVAAKALVCPLVEAPDECTGEPPAGYVAKYTVGDQGELIPDVPAAPEPELHPKPKKKAKAGGE